MSITVERAHVHAYTQEIHRLVAQMPSLLRDTVRVKTGIQGKTYNFERLGPSELAPITTRHSATQLLNPEHSRRRLSLAHRGGAILLDKQDDVQMIIQPNNDYARNHAESINRFWDDQIIAAATGTSTSVNADDTTTSVSLPAGQKIAAGGAGLTFAKVNQAVRIFNTNNVPYDNRTAVISPIGLEDLLNTTQATSRDFADLKAIEAGKLTGTWMSFNWKVSTRLSLATNTRTCIFYHKNAIGLGTAIDIYTSVSTRYDLNDATQVYAAASGGAVRIEEALVVQVDIDESV